MDVGERCAKNTGVSSQLIPSVSDHPAVCWVQGSPAREPGGSVIVSPRGMLLSLLERASRDVSRRFCVFRAGKSTVSQGMASSMSVFPSYSISSAAARVCGDQDQVWEDDLSPAPLDATHIAHKYQQNTRPRRPQPQSREGQSGHLAATWMATTESCPGA